MKEFRINKESDLIDIEIASGFLQTIIHAASDLGVAENDASLKRAIFPLLDGVEDPRTRCLIAVLMGCDVFPPELKSESFLKGLGPSKIEVIMKKVKDEQEGKLTFATLLEAVMKISKHRSTSSKLDEIVLCTLVDSMLFEPSNDTESPKSWMHGPPSHQLCRYNEQFSADNTQIIDGPKVAECPGPTPCNTHLFMENEGSRACASCQKTFCILCTSKVHKQDVNAGEQYVWMCARCFSHSVDDNHDGNDEDVRVAQLSQNQLREALMERTQVPANASLVDLQELYISIVEGSTLDFYDKSCMEVQYPQLSGNALSDGTLRILTNFEIREGGSFIRHNSLTPVQQASIVSMLADLVSFGGWSEEKSPNAAAVLPNIIIKCAQGMRPQAKGERLMKRCVRHAMDTRTESLISSKSASIFQKGADVGVIINHRIPASFKDATYDVSVAWSKKGLVAATCTCPAGDDGSDASEYRHGCVHVLPIAYLFSIFTS
jgi:hypothetical protein